MSFPNSEAVVLQIIVFTVCLLHDTPHHLFHCFGISIGDTTDLPKSAFGHQVDVWAEVKHAYLPLAMFWSALMNGQVHFIIFWVWGLTSVQCFRGQSRRKPEVGLKWNVPTSVPSKLGNALTFYAKSTILLPGGPGATAWLLPQTLGCSRSFNSDPGTSRSGKLPKPWLV